MTEVKQKITALKTKISKREDKLARIDKRIVDLKKDYKAVKKEIGDLTDEIRGLELAQLSETLERNSITVDDVAAAIADGSIKKTVPEAKDGAAEVSDNSEKEDLEDEVSAG